MYNVHLESSCKSIVCRMGAVRRGVLLDATTRCMCAQCKTRTLLVLAKRLRLQVSASPNAEIFLQFELT